MNTGNYQRAKLDGAVRSIEGHIGLAAAGKLNLLGCSKRENLQIFGLARGIDDASRASAIKLTLIAAVLDI